MLKTQALHGVGKLDVDAQVIGVEFQLIALKQAAILIDVHDQLGHLAVEFQFPMPIACRLALEIDAPGHRPFHSHALPAPIMPRKERRGPFAQICIIMPDKYPNDA